MKKEEINYNFYPLLEDFLKKLNPSGKINEATQPKMTGAMLADQAAKIPRIEDMEECVSPYTGKTINVKKVKKDMEAAKYKIVTQSPLYRPFIHEFDPIIYTWAVQTMATDGVRLFVNPEFADSLSWMAKIFVLIHEIYHCILMHMERGAGFNQEVFNIAGDFEINTIIVDTTDDFDEKFVKDEIKGLYDKKYLNLPVEQIYHDIIKNMPPLPPPPPPIKIDPTKLPKTAPPPGPPGPPQPPQKGEIELTPGTKVRIKATGGKGIIKSINPDGTFEVDPINEAYIMHPFINESYKAEDLIPILPPPPKSQGGGGGGGGIDIQGEYEQEPGEEGEEGGEGEGQGKGKKGEPKPGESKPGKGSGSGEGEGGDKGEGKESKPGGSKETAKAIASQTGEMQIADKKSGLTEEQAGLSRRMQNADRGRAGGFIDPKLGEQIARASGYDDEEMKAGESGRAKWESNAREIQKTAEKLKQAGSGRGDALINKLGKLLKGTVDWRAQLKLFVGSALSPEKQFRIGAKKHLYKSDEYLKRGMKPKVDAIKKVVVAVDVSGSMFHGNTFDKLIGEVNDIIFAKKIKEVTVIFFDDGVDPGSVQTVKPHGAKVWRPKNIKGGGGTDFQKPLDWIRDNFNDAINLCIFLTDGYASNPRVPKYFRKFIWVIYDNFQWEAPFGKVIHTSVSDI